MPDIEQGVSKKRTLEEYLNTTIGLRLTWDTDLPDARRRALTKRITADVLDVVFKHVVRFHVLRLHEHKKTATMEVVHGR